MHHKKAMLSQRQREHWLRDHESHAAEESHESHAAEEPEFILRHQMS
jgi:hypothetical protein